MLAVTRFLTFWTKFYLVDDLDDRKIKSKCFTLSKAQRKWRCFRSLCRRVLVSDQSRRDELYLPPGPCWVPASDLTLDREAILLLTLLSKRILFIRMETFKPGLVRRGSEGRQMLHQFSKSHGWRQQTGLQALLRRKTTRETISRRDSNWALR